MHLTQQGIDALQYEQQDKIRLAAMLIRGELDIHQFISGVCYDAAAFMKYLLSGDQPKGLGITDNDLQHISGQNWIQRLSSDIRWKYRSFIAPGSIITFRRLIDDQVFHAAVSIGMTSIRAINGHLLGAGWRSRVDLNLVLRPSHEYKNKYGGRYRHYSLDEVFRYDNTDIIVQVQRNLVPIPLT